MAKIYTVTLCLMDQDAGANPFWHTCFFLSRLDEGSKKLEVVDNYGFYGLPSTDTAASIRKLKIKLGFDIDLYGNHGMLRHEEVRFMDLGCGLHGVTFELTEEKFNELSARCKKIVADQEQAVKDVVEPLHLQGKPKQQTRIYPHEEFSLQIFALERAKAKQEKRPSRLNEFSLGLFSSSKTCKVLAIEILDGILTPEQIKRIKGGHSAISRLSGKTEKIYLHSSGPFREHKKRSGESVYYRDGNDAGVQLHWTMPPQEIETLSGEVSNLFKVDDEYCSEVKSIISKLQRIEWLFINAKLDQEYTVYRDVLVKKIRETYEAFATIEPKKAESRLAGLQGFASWLFSLPRDIDEANLLNKLTKAKGLLNRFYHAVVDNWELASDEPVQSAGAEVFSDKIDIEALAAYLSTDDQKKLCKILGRKYLEPEARTDEVDGRAAVPTRFAGTRS